MTPLRHDACVRRQHRVIRSVATLVFAGITAGGCPTGDDDALTVSEVIAEIGETVPLRLPREEDFLLSQLMSGDSFERSTGSGRAEARLLEADADERSFLIVAERQGGFERSDLPVFVELAEELGASPALAPVEGAPDVFASECCVARLVGALVAIGGDNGGRIKEAVLALD